MKKVQNPVQQRFQKEEENRIINSCVKLKSLNYEEIQFQEFSPIDGEEDWWFDDCFNKNKRR